MYVMKVWRQAGSLAVVVPKALCQAMRLVSGAHVVMSMEKDGSVRMKPLFEENGELTVKGGKK